MRRLKAACHLSRILRRCDESATPAEVLPLEEGRLLSFGSQMGMNPSRVITTAQVSSHVTPSREGLKGVRAIGHWTCKARQWVWVRAKARI